MDFATPLRRLTASSVAITFASYYLCESASRGPVFTEVKFYVSLYVIWMLHFSAWALYRIIIYPKLLSPLRHLPEPTADRSWWNGYMHRTFSGMNVAESAQWQSEIKHDGVFRYLGILNSERLVFTSVEGVVEVLQRANDFVQPQLLAKIAGRILGPGLVLVNGEEHKRQRRLLLPSFSTRQIRDLYPVFWSKAVETTAKFTTLVQQTASEKGFSTPFEIDYHAGHAALDSIKSPDSDLVRNYRRTFNPTRLWQAMAVLLKFAIPAGILDRIPIRQNKDVDTARQLLRDACAASVREKKALQAKGELTTHDIISALIRDRKVVEDEELVTHMMVMLGAGHETVVVGLTWTLYELCRRPEWQKALRAEARAKLPSPDTNSEPSAYSTEVDSMPLLNAFISESLRYWPPIPQVLKNATDDTTVAGVFVPATTKVVVSIYGFNRDPRNWGPDAAEFRPERWYSRDETTGAVRFDATGGALSKYSLMSFIHGPRDCIGRVFARHEMLCVLACCVGRFEFILSDESQLDEKKVAVSGGGFSSKPLHGIEVKARQVPGW
ncbi:Uu.00g014950.m01.CDS01 [Anthostomella pinea]|uniref:Uu.00g014950.m01.CDS01 n=1 Tax=Anthostomella pinea TaxID=933095 RepID=A0AAI8VSN4_9PEZI|nr:Uu.00g014950.m01.CDS01 [Anthostomella pinea]